jgi:hypothetical protein
MKNLSSGMDSILKMVLGVLAVCGLLIMVATNVDLDGDNSSQSGTASHNATELPQLPGQAPAQQASAQPATPAAAPASPMPANSAVPATAQAPVTGPSFAPAGQQFGDPMMVPGPAMMNGAPSSSPSGGSGSSSSQLPATPPANSAPAQTGSQPPLSAPVAESGDNLPDAS